MWKEQEFSLTYHEGLGQNFTRCFEGFVCTDHPLLAKPSHFSSVPSELLTSSSGDSFLLSSFPVPKQAPRIDVVENYIRYIPFRFPHYFVDLSGDFESYFRDNFSRNARKKLRKRLRSFHQGGKDSFTYKEYQTAKECRDFYSIARKVSAKTYQETWLNCGLPTEQSFLEQMFAFAEKGLVRASLLFLNDLPIAFSYGVIVGDGILRLDFGGYDPKFQKYSPGSILDLLSFQSAFEDSELKMIDLSEGAAEYKRRFATFHKECGNVYFIPDSLKNRAFVLSHQFFISVSDKIRKTLSEKGWDSKVRKILRYGVADSLKGAMFGEK